MRILAILTAAAFTLAAVPTTSASADDREWSVSSVVSAEASCAVVPCGPITVIITIILEKSKGIAFGDSNVFETKGKVSIYFDIDGEGYWYDPAKEMYLTFGVNENKQPPWLKTSIEPVKMKVPYRPWECPTCVQPEGSDPGQLQFYWEGDVKVKVEKLRDYTSKELRPWRKSDGTYRVNFFAQTDASMVGNPTTGQFAGLTEGYGPKTLKFLPEPNDDVSSQGADADVVTPFPAVPLLLASVTVGLAAYRRRR